MLKFLKGESELINVKERIKVHDKKGLIVDGAEVSVEFRASVIDSIKQSQLLDLARFVHNGEGRVNFIGFQLRNCIEVGTLKVNGTDVDAVKLAEMADLTHAETMGILTIISREIDAICFPTEEDKKK